MFKVNGLFYSFKMTSEEYNYFEKHGGESQIQNRGAKIINFTFIKGIKECKIHTI
jgi:hypothetical protein